MKTKSLTDQARYESLLKFAKTLRYRQNIICSMGPLDIAGYELAENVQLPYRKPFGLWYAYGKAWIDCLSGFNPKLDMSYWCGLRMYCYTHIYQIYLDKKHVLYLDNLKKMRWFHKKYGWGRGKTKIDWEKVMESYGAVDIRYRSDYEKEFLWYDGWDCSSGVILHLDALKNIKLLRCWIPQWTEFSEQ